MLNQRLDFSLFIDSQKSKAKKLLKQWLDFSFENKIETMERFPKI